MSSDLFSQHARRPLAARMRPHNLANFCGQEHLTGENQPLREVIEYNKNETSTFNWSFSIYNVSIGLN